MIEEKLSILAAAIQANTEALITLTAMQVPAQLGTTVESKTVTVGDKSVTDTTLTTSGVPAAPNKTVPAASNATGTVELDSKGYPWDERIHAKDHSKLAAGTWKLLRQLTSKYPDKADWHRYVESVKAEILAAVQAGGTTEQVNAGAATADTTQMNPLVGRVVNGVAIPEGVALGMENEWYGVYISQQANAAAQTAATTQPDAAALAAQTAADLQAQANANAQAQAQLQAQMGGQQLPVNPQTGVAYTIDDVRAAMMTYQLTKGAEAIVETLLSFAPKLEDVPAEQYGNLIGAMMLRPDLQTG